MDSEAAYPPGQNFNPLNPLPMTLIQASKLGYLAVARHAFEAGLRINAHHPLLLGRLLDVTLALGDWEAAGQVPPR